MFQFNLQQQFANRKISRIICQTIIIKTNNKNKRVKLSLNPKSVLLDISYALIFYITYHFVCTFPYFPSVSFCCFQSTNTPIFIHKCCSNIIISCFNKPQMSMPFWIFIIILVNYYQNNRTNMFTIEHVNKFW